MINTEIIFNVIIGLLLYNVFVSWIAASIGKVIIRNYLEKESTKAVKKTFAEAMEEKIKEREN